MSVIVYRVPIIDGAVQDGPKTYFQKYTSNQTPFFVPKEQDAKRFDDYQDADYVALEGALRSRTGFDWAPLEVDP